MKGCTIWAMVWIRYALLIDCWYDGVWKCSSSDKLDTCILVLLLYGSLISSLEVSVPSSSSLAVFSLACAFRLSSLSSFYMQFSVGVSQCLQLTPPGNVTWTWNFFFIFELETGRLCLPWSILMFNILCSLHHWLYRGNCKHRYCKGYLVGFKNTISYLYKVLDHDDTSPIHLDYTCGSSDFLSPPSLLSPPPLSALIPLLHLGPPLALSFMTCFFTSAYLWKQSHKVYS